MKKFIPEKQLFVYEKEKWQHVCEKDYLLPEPAAITEIKNGFILPLKKGTDVKIGDSIFSGGVCDIKGNFVAGLSRKYPAGSAANLNCVCAYKVPEDIIRRKETVIFGGILF